MLKMDKEFLKDLLAANIEGYAKTFSTDDENFECVLSDDTNTLHLKTTVEYLSGGDCDGSEIQKTTLRVIGDYEINEFIQQLVVFDPSNYSGEDFDKYDKNFGAGFYIDSEFEYPETDYYGNGAKVRILSIPIETIASVLLDFNHTKPLEELKRSLVYVDYQKVLEQRIQLNHGLLDESLEKKPTTKKVKI